MLFILLILVRTSVSNLAWINIAQIFNPDQATPSPAALTLNAATQSAPTFAPGAPFLTAGTLVEIRSGPGDQYSPAAIMEQGQIAEIVGVSEDRNWWAIRIPYLENGKGWVPAERVVAQNAGNVVVIDTEGEIVEQITKTPAVAQAVADVNIRSGPGLQFEKVGMLKNGQSAEILGADPQNYWWYISVPEVEGLQGWVAIDYVIARDADDVPIIDPEAEKLAKLPPTPGPGAPTLIALANVNYRSGAGKNFGILGTLTQDQRAEIVGVSKDGMWWAIKLPVGENGVAWVSANYVKIENTQNVPVLE
jgi:uncharacterized protein YraI